MIKDFEQFCGKLPQRMEYETGENKKAGYVALTAEIGDAVKQALEEFDLKEAVMLLSALNGTLPVTSPEIYETYRCVWDGIKALVRKAIEHAEEADDETRVLLKDAIHESCDLGVLNPERYLPFPKEKFPEDTAITGEADLELRPLLVTGRSISFMICDGGRYFAKEKYEVLIGGRPCCETENVVTSVYGLMPDTQYDVIVRSGGRLRGRLHFKTEAELLTINVRDVGAAGDGVQDDTHFIQTAILSCPAGGRVLIPAGTYRITQLFLKSNISIEIASGALLCALREREKYAYYPGSIEYTDESGEMYPGTWEGNPLPMYAGIVTGMDVEHITIYGQGTIDGNATKEDWWLNPKVMRTAFRPRLFFLSHCRDIRVQGLKFMNSPCWTIHPFFSDHLGFYDITEENPADSPNTDGLDPESCSDVEIAGVRFTLGDDCIAVKSGKIFMGRKFKKPSEDIHIFQCLMENGHGAVTIGSEMAGGVVNLTVEDCIFRRTDRGLRIKTRRGRGRDAVVENITFKNLDMDHVMTPFVANSFYFCDPDGKTDYVQSRELMPVDDRTPHIKSLNFVNIKATNCHVAGAYIEGLPEKKIDEVRMENVSIDYAPEPKKDVPAMSSGVEPCSRAGIRIRNVKKLILKNVSVSGQEGEALTAVDVDEIVKE